MLELGIGADILRGVGWIVRLLFLAAIAYAIWSGKNWKRKLLNVALVVLVFSTPLWPGIGERIRYERKYKAAKALFDERCKTAGEKIYRTAQDVDGVFLLKIRQYDVAQSNPLMAGAAAAHESYGDFYIRSFLLYEREPSNKASRALIEDETISSRPGYRYVDAIDPIDNKRYRYTLGADLRVQRQEAIDPPPRYGITFQDVVDPEERKHWVAGSIVRVIDLKTSETIGEFTRYVLEPGQGSRAGQRTPWLFAEGCHARTSYGRHSPRLFVDEVLKPTKGSVK